MPERNPFEGLIEATAAFDADVREISGKCPRCGLDRGGVVLRGQSKREAGICTCAGEERSAEDGATVRS